MMMNPSTRQVSPLSSGAGFSITSSVCIHERCPQNSPFISQPNGGKSQTALPDIQPATFIDHVGENKGISWCQDPIDDLAFHVMESEQNDQVGSGTIGLISAERADWSDWDPLISIRDDLDQYWSDLPVNGNVLDTRPQAIQEPIETAVNQIQEYRNQPLPSEEHSTVLDQSLNAHSTKPRMRWNQELHEAFVDSVSKLGGSERATPKGILSLMKVPGLTIYHVKSHLQKYRTARYKPELPEGLPVIKPTTIEDVKTEEVKTSMGITEALRLQVELQKRLHEQLETQRKLQLQIEEQGKYLQKMFEQHKTMGNKFKPSSPQPEQKSQETETGDEQPDSRTEGSDSPPAKRAKC